MKLPYLCALAGLSLGALACAEMNCTALGCPNGVQVTITTESGAWADGDYTLKLDADGSATDCVFSLPEDLPSEGNSQADLDCGAGLTAAIAQVVNCTTFSDGNVVGQSCEPVPDQFYVQVFITSQPESLSVELSRGEEVVLTDTQDPSYEEREINGPGCGVCRQATYELVVEP